VQHTHLRTKPVDCMHFRATATFTHAPRPQPQAATEARLACVHGAVEGGVHGAVGGTQDFKQVEWV
jgi:hypothetical protein